MPLKIIDIHWTAQHHEAVIPGDLGLRMGMPPKVRIADAKPTLPQQRMQGPEDFERDVLKND
jgi:hypothetical protein